jgi:NADP-dependent 3-hydroxy acid dehydrogenase YdfG
MRSAPEGGSAGYRTDMVDECNRMIDISIRGVLHGISAALPLVTTQRFGQFTNLSSMGGHALTPTADAYCATKFAVGRSLRLCDKSSAPTSGST